jgi:hypothetical protein
MEVSAAMRPTPTEARAEDDRDRLNWGLIVSVVFSIEFWIATAGVSLPHLELASFSSRSTFEEMRSF